VGSGEGRAQTRRSGISSVRQVYTRSRTRTSTYSYSYSLSSSRASHRSLSLARARSSSSTRRGDKQRPDSSFAQLSRSLTTNASLQHIRMSLLLHRLLQPRLHTAHASLALRAWTPKPKASPNVCGMIAVAVICVATMGARA